MYRLVGIGDILKTIYVLSYPHLATDQELSPAEKLRAGLRRHLQGIQPAVDRGRAPDIEFSLLDSTTRPLLEVLELEILERTPHESARARALEQVISGFSAICKRDPQLGDLFRLVINRILVTTEVDVAGSASAPGAVGILWVQPTEEWIEQDVVEALVHELTHTLLYLDEQRFTHYTNPDALHDQRTWVRSAIRSEARPVSGVAHSIIVAAEILCLREAWGLKHTGLALHGDSQPLHAKAAMALDALRSQHASWDLLSTRMKALIEQSDLAFRSFGTRQLGMGTATCQ